MSDRKAKKISAMDRVFIIEYLKDLDVPRAALAAGYSKSMANSKAFQWVSHGNVKPLVFEAIQAGLKKRLDRNEMTVDRVIKELSRIAFVDTRKLFDERGVLKPVHTLDDDTAAALESVEVIEKESVTRLDEDENGNPVKVTEPVFTRKAKMHSKMAAMGLAMQYLGVLKTRVEHTGANGGDIPVKISVEFVDAKKAA